MIIFYCALGRFHSIDLLKSNDSRGYGELTFGASADKPDGVRRLRREVVLLTDDRNLRVKALARDVPVRDVPAFLTWTSSSAALKS
jgi:PIN domain